VKLLPVMLACLSIATSIYPADQELNQLDMNVDSFFNLEAFFSEETPTSITSQAATPGIRTDIQDDSLRQKQLCIIWTPLEFEPGPRYIKWKAFEAQYIKLENPAELWVYLAQANALLRSTDLQEKHPEALEDLEHEKNKLLARWNLKKTTADAPTARPHKKQRA